MNALLVTLAVVLISLVVLVAPPPARAVELQNLDLPPQRRSPPDSVTTAARVAADAGNRFGWDLYGKLRSQPGNLLLSPFSISTALAMTYAGAAGTTASEMAAVLRLPRGQQRLHESYRDLVRCLESGATQGSYQLKIADRLWGQKGLTFREPFLRITRDQYGAQLEALDFAAAPEPSRQTINAWVSEKTEGKIKDLLAPGTIAPATGLVLTNAVYFYGFWAAQFDTMATNVKPFHVSPSKTIDVPLMHRKGPYSFGRAGDLSILEVPYRSEDVTMVVVLPDSVTGLDPLEGRLSAAALEEWLAALRPTEIVDVFLPRWRFVARFTLNGPLQALGMVSAFSPGAADFSGMDGVRDLFVSLVAHQAYVDVNEKGTEAAAATAVVMKRAVAEIKAPPVFRADHPFLFLIRDKLTGCILFLGRVENPADTAN